jgi:hypothetical protein
MDGGDGPGWRFTSAGDQISLRSFMPPQALPSRSTMLGLQVSTFSRVGVQSADLPTRMAMFPPLPST